MVAIDATACSGVVSLTVATKNAGDRARARPVSFTVTGTRAAKGVSCVYTPAVNADGTVTWACAFGSANNKYVPAECRI